MHKETCTDAEGTKDIHTHSLTLTVADTFSLSLCPHTYMDARTDGGVAM
jgi:hypothetical protein